MLLTEVGTNAHAFFPPTFIEQVNANGEIVQRYQEQAIDPWTVRMASLSLASAFMLFLFAWLRPDRKARNYMRAWGLYFIAQAAQKMAGLNVAESLWNLCKRPIESDWPFDVLIMGVFIGAAYLVNRFGHPGFETNPFLRIVWRKP